MCVFILGASTVDLKLTSGKTLRPRNVQHVPTNQEKLSRQLSTEQRWFSLVSKSNKCVLFKYGNFVGKDYGSRGLFRFSLSVNFVNHVTNTYDESSVWHSRLCHINFGCMARLANLSLIPKLTLVKKKSKYHVCAEVHFSRYMA